MTTTDSPKYLSSSSSPRLDASCMNATSTGSGWNRRVSSCQRRRRRPCITRIVLMPSGSFVFEVMVTANRPNGCLPKNSPRAATCSPVGDRRSLACNETSAPPKMASLHLPPRLAQDRVDRGGKKGAAPHAEDGKIWVSKILVTGFVHENHQAVGVDLESFTACRVPEIQIRAPL